MTIEEHAALTCMREHGGGFVSALAEAFFQADDTNFAKLKAAFPELLAAYVKLADEITQTRWPSSIKDKT